MREDLEYLFNDFAKKINVKDLRNKTVLDIGTDMNLEEAKEFVKLGVKEVYCVNPLFPDNLVSPDERIKLIKDFGENVKFERKFDCIFGVCLLEHVLNVEELLNEVNRMLKPNGVAYLQGCPMFLSSFGHHVWLNTPEVFYKFCNETSPFEPWEYLVLNTKEGYAECLLKKGLSEEIANSLANQYMSDFISKVPSSEIIKYARKIFGNRLMIDRWGEYLPSNKFYEMVKDKYLEEDLNTRALMLTITPVHYRYLKYLKRLIKNLKTLQLCYY